MLPWIKIESDMMLDERILKLMREHGFCGLGIYVALRLMVDSSPDVSLPVSSAKSVGIPYSRKKKLTHILLDFDLFDILDDKILSARPLAPAHRSAQTSAQTDALVPCEIQEIEKKKEETPKIFIKPTFDEVKDYCLSRGNGIDAQYFLDRYEAVGWMVGKCKMKDWRAAVRLWERNKGFCREGSTHSVSMPHTVPDNRPPRPSDTAQWDFATDSWNEFY